AIEHYSTAAEGGDLRAYNNLGLIYRDRNGSEHNDHGAVVFFQKGNLQEFYPCQCNLASMYEKGLDVTRDCETASTLFKRAARQGSLTAKRSLAEMYSFGLGVNQSETVARHLYLEAARWGDPEAVAFLSGEEYEGPSYDPVPPSPTTPMEMLALGLRYLDGSTIGLSFPSAVFWLESAAKAGSTAAMFVLGQIYENGYGTERSSKVAMKWYKWGAEKGNGACAYNYAYLYEQSEAADFPQVCLAMYQSAAENAPDDDIKSDALYSLGLFHSNGVGTEQSDEKALGYFCESAELGNASSQYLAGIMYLEGSGCEQSEEKAAGYLRMAADQGDGRAAEILSDIVN
ncbi:MAG: sel1 repeat family protein, partial [Candidatus Methanomethylophilus sp.]|nr:sel1 repeat family protein [Methanomethylophilus sp.]